MLEGLDAVAWHELSHAYGPASDVPGMLRDLVARDAKTRTRAHTLLSGCILHQGSVYEATSAAVPFLLELVGDESVPDRVWVLGFLASVAKETEFIYEPLPGDGGDPVRRVREAVQAGTSLYLRLLEHSQPAVRAAARRSTSSKRWRTRRRPGRTRT